MSDCVIETNVLVVGAGPAGAALACFLGQNGLSGIIISSANGTAETPRAHVVNPFAIECLRDIGLENDALRLGTVGRQMQAMRWCRSMTGEEYGKIPAMGARIGNASDVAKTTPCSYMDLPQSYLEPILVKYATHHNFEVNFNTQLVDAKRDDSGIICTIKKTNSNISYKIHTKYLFGADGGRSTVGRAFSFVFDRQPSTGMACNVLLNADLSHLMRERDAMLHFILKADRKWRAGLGTTIRMVRPYNQWLLTIMAPGASDTAEAPWKDFTPQSPVLLEHIRECIGDDSIDIEVRTIDTWYIRETVAESFSVNNDIFLVGDAAHRHPPAYGLGSNTCIQDAYNLAWKVAYVQQGLAGPSLLQSYNDERQPVGASLVKIANEGLREHIGAWEALGMSAPTVEQALEELNEIYDPTEIGKQRRKRVQAAFALKLNEGDGLGVGMNQWYTSDAIYLDDETDPRPEVVGDPVVKALISTYPGVRLPHAWLDISTRRTEISTHDLAGHGSFCLFTSNGGEGWLKAAKEISESTGIPLKAHGIGFGLEYHDVYGQWYKVREIEDDGCVLVRPDRYVAWRSSGSAVDPKAKLMTVLNKILCRGEL